MGVTLDISIEGQNTDRGCLRTACRREICHQFLQANAYRLPGIRPQPLPSTFLLIHYALVVLSIYAILLLSASFNKPQTLPANAVSSFVNSGFIIFRSKKSKIKNQQIWKAGKIFACGNGGAMRRRWRKNTAGRKYGRRWSHAVADMFQCVAVWISAELPHTYAYTS